MKKLLTLLLALPLMAHAWDWEGGVREDFITNYSYGYGSDAAARVFRELSDRGVDTVSLHVRLAWHGNASSTVTTPTVRSSFREFAVAGARMNHMEKGLALRPHLFENPGLGIARIADRIRPVRPDLTLASYQQQLAGLYKITREETVSELSLGAGLVHLMEVPLLQDRWAAFLTHARSATHPRTHLALEVSGDDDRRALENVFVRKGKLAGVLEKTVTKVNYHIPAEQFWTSKGELKTSLADDLTSLKIWTETRFGNVPVGLSRIWVPACATVIADRGEIRCEGARVDKEEVARRFFAVKNMLLALEQKGIRFEGVEIMEAGTDFEPVTPDARFLYFERGSSDPTWRALPPRTTLHRLPPLAEPASAASKRACVVHDKQDTAAREDRLGAIHALMLHTLMGAFKKWETDRFPITQYRPGRLDACDVVFYLATNFSQELPAGFLAEALRAGEERKLVWMGYKFPLLADAAARHDRPLAFTVPYIMNADTVPSPTNQDPGFFRFFEYKGEVFHKLAQWNPATNTFAANPEMGMIQIARPDDVAVLSWAVHSKNPERRTPYAVKTKNGAGEVWYFGDSPFSFTHYEDRYFIFADLLWDMVDETPEHEPVAMVRIEDVNPTQDLSALKWSVDYLRDSDVPMAFALIPFYGDSIGIMSPDFSPVFKPITKFPEFMGVLNYSRRRGVDIVLHGVAHMVGDIISGYDGISGADYEFWLYPQNTPLPFDSVDWVMGRFDKAEALLNELNIKTDVFEAPHYAASVLDYHIFAKAFNWTWHRSIYFPFTVQSTSALPAELKFGGCADAPCREERRAYLRNIEVDADYQDFGGQIVPYIVHKDVYGQSLIPETLGMIDFAFYSPGTWRPVGSPEDIIRRAKKLKVVRGAVASFFWHPQLLNRNSRFYLENPGSWERIGGKKSLTNVIDGLKDLGYKFISVNDEDYFPRGARP